MRGLVLLLGKHQVNGCNIMMYGMRAMMYGMGANEPTCILWQRHRIRGRVGLSYWRFNAVLMPIFSL